MDKEFNDYPELQLQEYEFTRPESGAERFPVSVVMTALARPVQFFSITTSNNSMH